MDGKIKTKINGLLSVHQLIKVRLTGKVKALPKRGISNLK